MMKKISLLLLLVLPLSAFAQELKFGHIDKQVLVNEMPEFAKMQTEMEDLALKYRTEINKLQTEYQAKVTDFYQTAESMDPAIRNLRESEIMKMRENLESFMEVSQEAYQKKQIELMTPIEQQINKAIKEVGDENGFLYIFELQSQAVSYHSSKSIDVLPLLKKKLNLK